MRILLTGATGYVGSRRATERLRAGHERGHEIFVASRNPARLGRFGWHDQLSGAGLDAGDDASVRAAFATVAGPIDVLGYLVPGSQLSKLFAAPRTGLDGLISNTAKVSPA